MRWIGESGIPVQRLSDGMDLRRKCTGVGGSRGLCLSLIHIYVEITDDGETVMVSMKNISATEISLEGRDITDRFGRGDESRNTEGSGLGPVSYTHLDVYKRQILYNAV